MTDHSWIVLKNTTWAPERAMVVMFGMLCGCVGPVIYVDRPAKFRHRASIVCAQCGAGVHAESEDRARAREACLEDGKRVGRLAPEAVWGNP
jgi:hypothetical protein